MKIRRLTFSPLWEKINIKLIINILVFVTLVLMLYITANINILSLGFLFDVLIVIASSLALYFLIPSNKAKDIINTIFVILVSILFSSDHLYYQNIKSFARISSLANFSTFLTGGAQYGVGIDLFVILVILLTTSYIIFTWTFKYSFKKYPLKKRLIYISGLVLLIVMLCLPIIMGAIDNRSYELIVNSQKFKFPLFIQQFGYIIYRYEDIANQIVSLF